MTAHHVTPVESVRRLNGVLAGLRAENAGLRAENGDLSRRLEAANAVIRKRAWNLPLTEDDLAYEKRVCDAWPRRAPGSSPTEDGDQ